MESELGMMGRFFKGPRAGKPRNLACQAAFYFAARGFNRLSH
jgi:hypothetical protein